MITHIELSGFKSIEHMSLDLRPVNVLIGANGAGKSNLVSFIELLRRLADKSLKSYLRDLGWANAVLFLGAKQTQTIRFRVDFQDMMGDKCFYAATLRYTPPDVWYFEEERYGFDLGQPTQQTVDLGSGHGESLISQGGHPAINHIFQLLQWRRRYDFADTSPLAAIRQHSYASDFVQLRPHGENLAAVLARLFWDNRAQYERIRQTIRQVIPWFHGFAFERFPREERKVDLQWRGDDPDHVYLAHQLPDGGLRAIALITLLLLLDDYPASTIAIDEPELGLHPLAMAVIVALIRQAAHHHQFILATQSVAFVEHFETDEIVVVERCGPPGVPEGVPNPAGHASNFRRLSEQDLADWLEDYSIGELWERGVIGGGPA